MKEKRIQLAGVELALALDAGRVDQLKRSVPYRFAVQPARKWLARRGAARAASNGHVVAPPPTVAPILTPEARGVLGRVEQVPWYHVIDLPHGVATPGFVDHRQQVDRYGLPRDMRGLKVLDVATYDGFWAFEMERRGAEVVAVDLDSMAQCDFPARLREQALAQGADRPTGAGFRLAHELLGSHVDRRISSVYELSAEKLGTFDVVFLSDLLLHLRDPFGALESVYTVTKSTGHLILAEPFSPELEAYKNATVSDFVMANEFWWMPSVACLKKMLQFAGFARVDELARFKLQANVPIDIHKVVLHAFPESGT